MTVAVTRGGGEETRDEEGKRPSTRKFSIDVVLVRHKVENASR